MMLYTLGYSGWTPEAIQEEAQARNAIVAIFATRHARAILIGPRGICNGSSGRATSMCRRSVIVITKAAGRLPWLITTPVNRRLPRSSAQGRRLS